MGALPSCFDALPLKERLFVRARLSSAPLEELARRAPTGRVADLGCGHGVLVALLAEDPQRKVVGIDPDPRKIDWARQGPGRLPNVRLEVADVEALAAREAGAFDAVCVADVLYLLPLSAWHGFLAAARRLLRPGGVLLIKEAEADGSWKHRKALWQERLMVRLLRRTRDSGGLGFQPRAVLTEQLTRAGFEVREVIPCGAGYATPHLMMVASPA